MRARPVLRLLAGLALALLGACATNPTRRCANDHECQDGDVCYRGFCIAGGGMRDAATPDAAITCPFGQAPCDRACVNLQTDRDHCGTCDTQCHGMTGSCASAHCVTGP